MGIKHFTPRSQKVINAYEKEKQKYKKIITDAIKDYAEGKVSSNEMVNLLRKIDVHVSQFSRRQNKYFISAYIPGGDFIMLDYEPLTEAIKHLGPKSDDELRRSLVDLTYREKLYFAKENKLDWLKKEAEEELKKDYKKLPLHIQFEYAKDFKIDWLLKEAEKQFRKETKDISPTFLLLFEQLKKIIGEDFEYEVDYHLNGYYDLRVIFIADGVYFLLNQSTRENVQIPPEIKVAKKTAGETTPFFFTDGVYISTVKQMMAFIKTKIKQAKQ